MLRIITSLGLSLIFVYFSEFFPTCLRCVGLATIFSMDSVASIISNIVINIYNINDNDHNIKIVYLWIVVATSIISIFLNKFLPETLGRNLRD